MSYIHEQNRNGNIYVYEISSYWDKKKKQPRQRRVYLGRKDKLTGKLIEGKKKLVPIGSRSVGSIHFFSEISKQIGLSEALKNIFPDDYKQILYLSFFKIIRREAYYLYPFWCEEFYTPGDVYLNSQSISDFLLSIGQDEKRVENFFMSWMTTHSRSSKAVMFDITSISSYGFGNEFLERGYNRDGENLRQTNLGILSQDLKVSSYSKSASLPVGYRIYPGSINDVITLSNIISLAREYKMDLKCLVLDKGFYSQENIKSLSNKGLSYIIPMSFSTKLSMEVINSLSKDLASASSSFMFNGKAFWYHKKNIKIGKVRCLAHVYLDKSRRCDQESALTDKICDFERVFSNKSFKDELECKEYISETLKSQKKFFKIVKKGEQFCIERDIENIEKEIDRMGTFILLTEEKVEMSRDDILSLYKNKDSIEKIFLSLKHNLNEKRNRTHSLMTMRGSVFISFISLILISWMDHIMKERGMYKKFSKFEIYKILDRLKFYELATNQVVLGEISGQQKAIFSAFKIGKNIKPSYHF